MADNRSGLLFGRGAMSSLAMLRVLVFIPMLILPSCIPEDEPAPVRRVEAMPPRLPEPPAPAFFKVDAKFSFDLPEKTAAQLALPAQFKGTLVIDLRAEAVEPAGRRSRLIGRVDMKVSDPEGRRDYAVNSISMEGESDGKPSEVMGRGMERAAEAVNMLIKSLPGRAGEKPTPAPAASSGKAPAAGEDEPVKVHGNIKVQMDLGR